MAEDNAVQIAWPNLQNVHIVDESIGTHACVKEKRRRAAGCMNRYERRVAVFGHQSLAFSPWQIGWQSRSPNLFGVGKKHVDTVIHQDCDFEFVYCPE